MELLYLGAQMAQIFRPEEVASDVKIRDSDGGLSSPILHRVYIACKYAG